MQREVELHEEGSGRYLYIALNVISIVEHPVWFECGLFMLLMAVMEVCVVRLLNTCVSVLFKIK
jgi:hypothetical protein